MAWSWAAMIKPSVSDLSPPDLSHCWSFDGAHPSHLLFLGVAHALVYLPIFALRTFAPIATAHPYSAHKFTCHVMHRARALSTKMNNDRADGHCYSFAWI